MTKYQGLLLLQNLLTRHSETCTAAHTTALPGPLKWMVINVNIGSPLQTATNHKNVVIET